jgi:general secretion pathway protein E
MTFATGLLAVLRQDPDIIMVGEIRDEETARMAVQASLTGHLVFSTLQPTTRGGGVPGLFRPQGVDPTAEFSPRADGTTGWTLPFLSARC